MLNPLDLIPKPVYLVVIILLTITTCTTHWDNQSLRVDVAKGHQRIAELNVAITAANTKAAVQSYQFAKQVSEAQDERTKLLVAHSAETSTLRTARDGLLRDLSAYRAAYSTIGSAQSAGHDAINTLTDLFGQCTERYSELAEKADGHVIDVVTLTTAWPVIKE